MPADSNSQRHCIELRANNTVTIVKNCLTTTDSIFDMDGYNKDSSDVIQCITNGNPYLKNISLDNFHLTDSSECIDVGLDVYAPYYDIDGILRPQGLGYDIGAYEYKD